MLFGDRCKGVHIHPGRVWYFWYFTQINTTRVIMSYFSKFTFAKRGGGSTATHLYVHYTFLMAALLRRPLIDVPGHYACMGGTALLYGTHRFSLCAFFIFMLCMFFQMCM